MKKVEKDFEREFERKQKFKYYYPKDNYDIMYEKFSLKNFLKEKIIEIIKKKLFIFILFRIKVNTFIKNYIFLFFIL